MKNKTIITVVISFLIAFIAHKVYIKVTLPIKYYICGEGYIDCNLVARFYDLSSCESAKQKAGWYCNQTDKSNIICQEKESFISDSYCTE